MEFKFSITRSGLKSFLALVCFALFFIPASLFLLEINFGHGDRGGLGYLCLGLIYHAVTAPYLFFIPIVGLSMDMYNWKERVAQGCGFLERLMATAVSLILFVLVFGGSFIFGITSQH